MNKTERLVKSKAISITKESIKKFNDVRGASIKVGDTLSTIRKWCGPKWYMTYFNEQTLMFNKLSLKLYVSIVLQKALQSERKG